MAIGIRSVAKRPIPELQSSFPVAFRDEVLSRDQMAPPKVREHLVDPPPVAPVSLNVEKSRRVNCV